MKNNLNMFLFYTILGIILMTISVTAYDSTDIKAYYSLDDTILTKLVDSQNNYNITGTGQNYRSQTAKILNGIYHNGTISGSTQYNTTIFDIYNNSFTINFWIKHNSSTGSDEIISIKNDTGTSYFNIRFGIGNIIIGTKGSTTGTQECNFAYTNSNNYSMITVTYNQNSNSMLSYLNGDLQAYNTSMNSLRANSNKLYLGISYYDVIDEISIFDTSLTGFEIAQLYNNGEGFNYNQTLENTNITNIEGCIDSDTYCTNILYNIVNGVYNYFCNSQAESQFCSGGCNNDVCDTTGIAECSISGESKCVDSTNYAVCSDSNSDGYLDFGELHTCAIGKYCVDFFHLADCKNVSQSGVHDIYGLLITPYAINGDNTTYNVNQELKTVNVNTIYSNIQQKFYTTGTYYISRTCDYKETQTFSSGYQLINNYTQITFNSASNLPTIIRLSILPLNDENGSIEFRSQSDTSLGTIRYSRNVTAKRLCLYNNLYNEIYCDYDYTGSDTLNELQLKYTLDFTRKLLSIRILFNRTFPQQKALFPIAFSANDVYRLYINASNTAINTLNVFTIPQLNQFTSTTNNSLTILPCLYDSLGTRKVRTYGNNDGSPDYNSYSDYNVNINGLGLSAGQLAFDSDAELSWEEKHFVYALLITLILSIIVTAMIGFISRGSEKVGGIALIAFLFTFLGGLVFFSLPMIGWMNTLFALLVGLLDAVFIAITFKIVFFST